MNPKEKSQRSTEKRDWRNEKIFSAVLVALGLGFLAYHQYKPAIIGHSLLYNIFIEILLSLTGGLAFTIYLIRGIEATIALWKKTVAFAIVFVCAALLSFAVFGLMADVGFNYLNYKAAKKNPATTVTLPVTEFHEGNGRHATYKVYFNFEGSSESLATNRETIKYFIAHKDTKKHIRIKLRKGIWNHYLVEDWEVVE